MEALALAERLDLERARVRGDHHPQRAEEGRAQGGPARAPWSTRSPAPRRPAPSTPSCAAGSCSAGRSRTGPSSTRPRAGSAARSTGRVAAGVPWAPYAFECPLAADLDPAGARRAGTRCCELTDVAPGSPPPIPRALLDALRMTVEQARGADVGGRGAASCAGFWAREGAVAIHAARARDGAGRAARRPRRRDRRCTTTRCRARPDLARVVQRPDPARRRRRRRGRPGDAVARRRPSGRRTSPAVERISADGHIVLDRYSDPSGHWGPEGRAWVKRLDAETLRVRWLAGVDAPPRTCWSTPGARPSALFEDFGNVHELARSRTALAGILRATGDLAGAREQRRPGPRGRAPARRAAAARRAPRDRRSAPVRAASRAPTR